MTAPEGTWSIDNRYRAREKPVYFVDDVTAITGVTWQPDVYVEVAEAAVARGAGGIVDMGCGHALKLARIHERHSGWRFIGIDYRTNIEWCRSTYDFGIWLDFDFEKPFRIPERYVTNSVVVCSDVVEHLIDPSCLLDAIACALADGAVAAFLSTPDRATTYPGMDHLGPPLNPCHVREWTLDEFGSLLRGRGFHVERLELTRCNDQPDGGLTTTLAVVIP
jgi:hypothetical protein